MLSTGLPRKVSQTTHATILTDSLGLLQKVTDGMERSDWHVTVFKSTTEDSFGCSFEHAGVKGNGRKDRLEVRATIMSSLHLGRSEVLKSLGHYLRTQNQGHQTIDHLEERGTEKEALDDLP